MSDDVVQRIVTQNLAAMAGQSPQRVLEIAFAALKPGDEVGEGLYVTKLEELFREQNKVMRETRADARQKAARQAAEAVREALLLKLEELAAEYYACGRITQRGVVLRCAEIVGALDRDKILEDQCHLKE